MFKLLELFGGIGAPRMALENLGIDVKSIDYVEIDSNAVKAYNALFDNSYKSDSVIDWNLDIDLLFHGSPCQDFSIAGSNDISKGRSILYQRTLDIIEYNLNPRPKYVIWENVPGLLSKKNVHHFYYYFVRMSRLGYHTVFDVISGLQAGIPQHRERVFVVSIRNDIKNDFSFSNIQFLCSQPLINFLDSSVDSSLDITQPSMIRALNNGKVKVSIDYVPTISTKNIRWNSTVVPKDFHDPVFHCFSVCGFYPVSSNPNLCNLPNKESLLRYLSSRERFRLMGFTDEQFNRVLSSNISRTSIDTITGNSIIVQVLMLLFGELFSIPNYRSLTVKSIENITHHKYTDEDDDFDL